MQDVGVMDGRLAEIPLEEGEEERLDGNDDDRPHLPKQLYGQGNPGICVFKTSLFCTHCN